MRVSRASCVLLGGLILLLGCGTKEEPPEKSPNSSVKGSGPKSDPAQTQKAPEVPAQFVAARWTFDTNCAKCHSTVPQATRPTNDKEIVGGPKGARNGPNLATVGAKRSRDWLIRFIRDPRTERPKSLMPKFDEAKISTSELEALADYLGSLK